MYLKQFVTKRLKETSGFASKLSQVYQPAYFSGERGLHVVLLVLKLLFYLNNTIPAGTPAVKIWCDLQFPFLAIETNFLQ